jgi:hyperosmotically inducible periplasmic protein
MGAADPVAYSEDIGSGCIQVPAERAVAGHPAFNVSVPSAQRPTGRLYLQQETPMFARTTLAALVTAVVAITVLPGCAVTRGQSTVGEYIDDTAVTTAVKAKFVENQSVDASAISVETLEGTVMLSGFAKNSTEKATAENIARGVKGVKSVKNQIVVRG